MRKQKFKSILSFNIPEKYKTCSGIYMIANSITNQVYIGRTTNFLKRYKEHNKALAINSENHKFKTLFLLYPEVTFTYSLIEITTNIIEREIYYIKYYDSVNNGLNILYTDNDAHDFKSIHKLDSYKQYIKLLNNTKYIKHKTISKVIPNITKISCNQLKLIKKQSKYINNTHSNINFAPYMTKRQVDNWFKKFGYF